jgi:hypothetical protein
MPDDEAKVSGDPPMPRHFVTVLAAVPFVLAVGTPAGAALKKVPYPEVKVQVVEPYKGDAAFTAMRQAFAEAVGKKDTAALFALVGPTFVWTQENALHEEFELGRDALHNFKVVFGFREPGKDTDGGVDSGPFWDLLAAFAADPTVYEQGTDVVCTPTTADIVDDKAFELARTKIETDDDVADWYFTLAETPVAKAPDDGGAPIGKLGTVAIPVLTIHPPTPEGSPAVPPTHYEVLMPNGRTGWIPASAARSYSAERLCFAKTAKGEWKIVSYDQPAAEEEELEQ